MSVTCHKRYRTLRLIESGPPLRLPYVGGLPALRSCETAVTSWAGAKGFANMILLGTPFDAQSSACAPLMYMTGNCGPVSLIYLATSQPVSLPFKPPSPTSAL